MSQIIQSNSKHCAQCSLTTLFNACSNTITQNPEFKFPAKTWMIDPFGSFMSFFYIMSDQVMCVCVTIVLTIYMLGIYL